MTFTSVAPATRRKIARPTSIPVLPAVDTNLGSVSFATPGGYHQYWSAEPGELVDALTQAVRPAQWIPEIATLVVTVAQTGIRAGRRIGFGLTAH